MSETGSVKFTCERIPTKLTAIPEFAELNRYRRKLIRLGLIGVDSNGIGFGNMSIRDRSANNFYITGSGTGERRELDPSDYARVVAYDFERNWLRCEGSTVASSESLTHAAIYESEPAAGAIIHGHDLRLWAALFGQVPTTAKLVAYGTPEMANEVEGLFKRTDLKQRKVLVMGGHEGGIVAFGRNVAEAFGVISALT